MPDTPRACHFLGQASLLVAAGGWGLGREVFTAPGPREQASRPTLKAEGGGIDSALIRTMAGPRTASTPALG